MYMSMYKCNSLFHFFTKSSRFITIGQKTLDCDRGRWSSVRKGGRVCDKGRGSSVRR